MTKAPIDIRPFDPAGATDREYAAMNHHENRAKQERQPEDPPTPLDEMTAIMQNIPPFVSVEKWVVWDHAGTEIVADAEVAIVRMEENTHLAHFGIVVEPDYRRRGTGRELLRRVAEVARREGRRLMMTHTSARISAGEAFMERLGAERGQEMHINRLLLADLDRDVIARWQAAGRESAAGFTMVWRDGPYPDDQIDAIAALTNSTMNTAPRDRLDIEDINITPEHLRQIDRTMTASGIQRWMLYASEAVTGRLAGFTEVTWNPNRPEVANQGATGVYPEFRRRGLGRWLKAAMLERVLADRPDALSVRTGNADSNAAMRGINIALGFQPYIAHCTWQLETSKVVSYLGGGSG